MKFFESGCSWLIEDQLDNQLVNDIKYFFDKNLESLHQNSKDYSTSGNAKQFWIEKGGDESFHHKSKEYENIELRFRKQIYAKLKSVSLLKKGVTGLHQKSAWTIIGEEGSYHTIHNHSVSTMDEISTVLYLNVPESKCEDKSNYIFLVLHTDPSNHFTTKGCPSFHHIKPEVGKVLIFPHHIPHGTYPQTKGIRQTFNIDYSFTMGSKSSFNYY